MFQVVELPEKHHVCKVRSLNKGDANSEVTAYYQVGPPAAVLVALCESSCVRDSVARPVGPPAPEGPRPDGAAGGESLLCCFLSGPAPFTESLLVARC